MKKLNNKKINETLIAWLKNEVIIEKLKKLAIKTYEDMYDNFKTEVFIMLDTDGNIWEQYSVKPCYENEIIVFSIKYIQPELYIWEQYSVKPRYKNEFVVFPIKYIQPELYCVESMSENEFYELEKELYMDNADSVINDLMYGIDQTIDFLS